ncbi:hypothetical protein J6590_061691 [Homalodisca vitripennis]|nr:hypothetical protein J6590_061691 [Homalodisca vitripennis]
MKGLPSLFLRINRCGKVLQRMHQSTDLVLQNRRYSAATTAMSVSPSPTLNNIMSDKTMRTPWRDIVTSVPLWALLIAHLGQNWGFWMLLTMLPNYLSHVLGFNIKSNGLISSIPYMVMWGLTIVFSWIADYINEKRLLPLNVSRKMWNTIAHWGGAAALVALSLISTSVTGAVVLLTVSVALNAGVYTGFLTNHLDLSPNFAGLLMGITNGMSNVTSILSPMITGFIVSDQQAGSLQTKTVSLSGPHTRQTSRDQWMVAFYISAAIFFVGNLVFIVFGSTDVQPWNDPLREDSKNEKENKSSEI